MHADNATAVNDCFGVLSTLSVKSWDELNDHTNDDRLKDTFGKIETLKGITPIMERH